MLAFIFLWANTIVFFIWLMMIFLPNQSFTKKFLNSSILWILCGLLYFSLLLLYGGSIDWKSISMPTYQGITQLFLVPETAAIAWIHLIIFDLFAGRFILLDMTQKKRVTWHHIPYLSLTLMAGPLGLALYLVTRSFARKKWHI